MAEDFSINRRIGLLGSFLGSGDLVSVNGFLVSSSRCAEKSSASGVEQGFEDDFWDTGFLVFLNSFSVSRTLCGRRFHRPS